MLALLLRMKESYYALHQLLYVGIKPFCLLLYDIIDRLHLVLYSLYPMVLLLGMGSQFSLGVEIGRLREVV